MVPIAQGTAELESFFEEAVREAAKARGYDPQTPSAVYLRGILTDYARPASFSHASTERPLAFAFAEALEAPPPERFERLRRLGDHVLYVAGFFADHLERTGASRTFVLGVGAKAYGAASVMMQRPGPRHGPDVFDELASNFGALALVLGDVADALYATSARDPRSVLELYERWTRRGSHALALALVRSGAAPVSGSRLLH